jgi:hypothetical protein
MNDRNRRAAAIGMVAIVAAAVAIAAIARLVIHR